MRGAFLISILLSFLIVSFLVIKDFQTGPTEDTTKKEAIEQAEKAKEAVNDAMDKIKATTKHLKDSY